MRFLQLSPQSSLLSPHHFFSTEGSMKRFFAVVVAASCCLNVAAHGVGHGHMIAQQTDWSQVEIKTTKVAGNVYMLEGRGGNIGVTAGPDGLLIVDDQFAPLAEKIRAALRQINPGALKFVLNTHWHGDHTGGNAALAKEATLVAHTNVRKRLAAGSNLPGRVVPAAPKEALPVITYDNAVSFHFNGEEIRAIHFPAGHTDGDSVEGLTRNIEEVIQKAPAGVKVIPGHGPLSTVDDLKTYLGMLRETTDLIRERIRQGKTVEQAKAEGLPEKWKSWGSGFINTDRWIETIYRSLGEKKAGAHAAPRE